jgi:hypothetical protein
MLPQSDLADEDALAILDQVQLHSFTATPGTITPFAASLLAWNVNGPPGFSLHLESKAVAKIGEQHVTPLSSKAFHLRASAGRIKQVLGIVTVTVDQSACRLVPVPNQVIRTFVVQVIDEMLMELSGTTRRAPDVVTVDQSGIGIKLALKKVVPHFPNPDVDVNAHWSYLAVEGELVAHFDVLTVSVNFPWWVWLLPIAYPGLPIAIDLAKDSTKAKVRKKAADGADALESFVASGLRIHSTHFNPANFEMLACPDSTLRLLVLPGAPAFCTAGPLPPQTWLP